MMAGTLAVELDSHVTLEMDYTQGGISWPTSSFVSVRKNNQVYLANVMVVLVFYNVHPNLILILLCV